jgi:hypothetical protein
VTSLLLLYGLQSFDVVVAQAMYTLSQRPMPHSIVYVLNSLSSCCGSRHVGDPVTNLVSLELDPGPLARITIPCLHFIDHRYIAPNQISTKPSQLMYMHL